MNIKKLNRNTAIIMLVIIFSKITGILRDIILAEKYGTSNISDAYLISISIPTLIFYFIGHSISTAYQPMFNKIREEKGEKSAVEYTNKITTISLLICTIIVIILLIFTRPIVKVFAVGFDEQTIYLTSQFIRISAASLFFMTIISVWGGYLQVKENFIVPAAISVPRNAVLVISIILSVNFGIICLGYGILFAYIAEFIFMLPFVIKNNFKFKFIFSLNDNDIKETLYIIIPILLGVGVSQINKMIDKSLASTIISGGISALNYAAVINNAVQEVLVTGIITILFADCTKLVAKGKHEVLKNKLRKTINITISILLPATFGVILLSEQIVRYFLCRGSFDELSLSLTKGALCCYTIGLPFLALRDMLVKVFYAYKDTKATTIISIIAIFINVVFNIILSSTWGINGLASATSISAIFNSIILFLILRKKIGDFGIKSILINTLKSLFGCIIMAFVIKFAKTLFNNLNSISGVIICVMIGIISYSIVSIILKNELVNIFSRKNS